MSDDFKTLLHAARILNSIGAADIGDEVMAALVHYYVPDGWRGTPRIGELYRYVENWDAPLPASVEDTGDQRTH
jgi:hypothetical protein